MSTIEQKENHCLEDTGCLTTSTCQTLLSLLFLNEYVMDIRVLYTGIIP
jgi:hypothetical protein